MKKGELEEAEKIYWEKMFRYIEEKFVNKIQDLIEKGEIPQYDLLVIPMGLEASYFILLINGLKPKEVYFLCTKEAEEYFLDKVIEKTGLTQARYKKDIVKYAGMDVGEVYGKIRRRLKMFEGKKIAVDLTRGKRIMSAGAAIVGGFFNCDLIYIDESWIDEIKRGKPGSEKLTLVKNPFDIFGDLQQRYAIELFNVHEYAAAHKMFNALRNNVSDPREFEAKSLIAQSYNFWDAFDFKRAFYLLKESFEKIERYGIKDIDRNQIKSNLSALEILQSTHSQIKTIDLLKNEDLVIHLLVDVYSNAHRRMEQKRFEDAVSRFYRAIELVSQHRLAKRGFNSSSPNYALLDAPVQEEYNKITREIYREEKTLPLQTALKTGHSILFVLEDDIWKSKSIQDLKNFIECIRIRDYSIVAHGIHVLNQNSFRKFKEIVRDMILRFCEIYDKNFEKLGQQHTHLKLNK